MRVEGSDAGEATDGGAVRGGAEAGVVGIEVLRSR
jgi:hypothetical protein